MSQVNQMLNSLSQNGASQGASELKAARIKPLPKSQWPVWLISGLMIAGMAGATGWWFGQRDREPAPVILGSTEVISIPDAQASPEAFPKPVEVAQVAAASPQDLVEPESEPEPVHKSTAERAHHSGQQAVKPQSSSATVVDVERQPNKATAAVDNPRRVPSESAGTTHRALPAQALTQASVRQSVPVAPASVPSAPVTSAPVTSASVIQASAQPEVVTAVDAEPEAEGHTEAELLIERVALPPEQLAQVDYDKAMKALGEGDSPKALEYLKSALEYQPDWVEARQQLSALYYGRGDVRRAMLTLQQGLAKQPAQQTLRLTLAKLLASESQPEVALDVLSELPQQPDSEFLALRGALAQQLKNQPLALSSYQQLIETEPFDGRWWLGLGIALDRNQQTADAVAAYRKALKLGQVSGASQQFIRQRLSTLKAQEG
ncbi:tetratricopeptide repeat protein [Photobacterium galatheae]|uniref:Uncharacterized protein n=1 Tax=Photobacterium galatheae TaxID=1654360 RepID=A0A066RZJ6_9GAMM|nr:tetratricopeptide repeat protein [Photobacterium galatheae]KDM92803.1 hypothetical protein EA58_05375 [Photobacterium galatheae]MCM0149280.1 tetratricopeptide repeat protein [Photobacterium galatheae]